MKLLEGIAVPLAEDEIVHLLRGTKRNTEEKQLKQPSNELLENIRQIKEIAIPMINPKAIYDIFQSRNLIPKHMFMLSEKTILAICTISINVEQYIAKLMKNGELTKGIILDAIASQAAEEVAEEVSRRIIEENEELFQNNESTARFSPGYCKWGLAEGQDLIFKLLPAEKIDVKLTSSKMMIPRKSISFAINFGKEVEKELGKRECSNCNLLNCGFRKS